MNIVIGVEGMVSSGKSTMCRELIKKIPNCIYFDAGYIYRGIVLAMAKNKIDINSKNLNPLDLMNELKVEFIIEDGITEIYIDGTKIERNAIESVENSMDVSKMASHTDNKPLFAFAQYMIDNYKKHFNIICSGRDMVDLYPNMNCHLFVTASLEERINRRFKQYDGKYSLEEIRDMIEKRDELHEKSGFNKKCDVTIELDTTDCKSAEESAEKALKLMKENGINF